MSRLADCVQVRFWYGAMFSLFRIDTSERYLILPISYVKIISVTKYRERTVLKIYKIKNMDQFTDWSIYRLGNHTTTTILKSIYLV